MVPLTCDYKLVTDDGVYMGRNMQQEKQNICRITVVIVCTFIHLIMTICMYYLMVKNTELELNESLYKFDPLAVAVDGHT
jgi:hypothetical protein